MQANRRGLLKQEKPEKTRNKLRWKLSAAVIVADRNRLIGFGQRLRLSMTGCFRDIDGAFEVHSSLLNVVLHDEKFHRRGSHRLDIAKICLRRAGYVVATVSSRNNFQNHIPMPRRSGTAAR